MIDCGILDIDWAEYLENALPARARQGMESHLRACPRCREELENLRRADLALRIECGILRESIELPAAAEAAALERILGVLRDHAPKGENERLWRVRWVLALLCGYNTAAHIIRAAESQAAKSDGKWPSFLRRLSFLTTEICGSYAGNLIWAIGQ